MEDNSQQRRQGQSATEQLDFSGRVLSDGDAPRQLDFSGKTLSEQDTLESPISPSQPSQDQDASQPPGQDDSPTLVSSNARKFPQTISSGTAAALNTFMSVLAQPPIPKLPQYLSRSSHSSNRRRLPVVLIGLSAALVAVILFVLIVFPGSNIPQSSSRAAANAPATAATGNSSSPTKTTPQSPTTGSTQPPAPANNGNPIQQQPANNGNPTNGNPPGTAPAPPGGTNPAPAPPPVTPPAPVANSGVIMVSPGAVQVNNDCQSTATGFSCTLTVSPAAGHNGLILWVAHPEGLGAAVVLPLTGTLLLGSHMQVTVLLPTCMNGGDVRFTADGTTAVVPFSC